MPNISLLSLSHMLRMGFARKASFVINTGNIFLLLFLASHGYKVRG